MKQSKIWKTLFDELDIFNDESILLIKRIYTITLHTTFRTKRWPWKMKYFNFLKYILTSVTFYLKVQIYSVESDFIGPLYPNLSAPGGWGRWLSITVACWQPMFSRSKYSRLRKETGTRGWVIATFAAGRPPEPPAHFTAHQSTHPTPRPCPSSPHHQTTLILNHLLVHPGALPTTNNNEAAAIALKNYVYFCVRCLSIQLFIYYISALYINNLWSANNFQ